MRRKKETTALANWDDELAKEAEIAAGAEAGTGGGQFFSVKGGNLSFQDSPLPNNEMVVIILDTIFETVYYEGRYNPDKPQGPKAFAFGRDESELRWHENSAADFAGELCSDSEVCEWGSADTGKGKAARETRRLAMIPAGQYNRNGELEVFENPDHYATTPIGFMKLPVTSVKGYANFVKQVAGALKRPPFGVITRVSVVSDDKTQFKVLFEPLEKVSNSIMDGIMKRRTEAMSTIDFPYQVEEVETKASRPTTRRRGRKY